MHFANHHLRPELQAIVDGPIIVIILPQLTKMMFLGRGIREREHAADCLAAGWIGDPELYIRAITKIHTLNAAPGRLKPSDEALSTHPSLVHRIEAIRSRPAPGSVA